MAFIVTFEIIPTFFAISHGNKKNHKGRKNGDMFSKQNGR